VAEARNSVLLVDDEEAIRYSFSAMLQREGFHCETAASAEEAEKLLEARSFDVLLTDIRLPGKSGVELMREVKQKYPDTIVLLITAHASVETAIEAVREGASDYIRKPVRHDYLTMKIRSLLRARDLEWENRVLKIERRARPAFEEIVGHSAAIEAVKEAVLRVSQAKGNVLIEGESGTGKELVARAIHASSAGRRGAFVAVNCGAVPATLLEAEFFGFKKGAFTDAASDKEGLFEQARGGTLFLDEVAELPLTLQPKILRAIETKEIRPLGATRPVSVETRIVAATNKSLQERVRSGDFREDLFYRLNVFYIRIPPLRERPEDIPVLALHFLDRYAAELRSPARRISPEALALLQSYPWRGNVRELQNVIQRAVITSRRAVLGPEAFEGILGPNAPKDWNLKRAVREFERAHIRRVLEESGGDKRVAAQRLGISLASLYSKLKGEG